MARLEVELTHFAANLQECPAAPLPEFALSGRSNVGKSSLLNYLVGHKKLAHTSGQPGKTRCFTYYQVESRWNLVDMPGYGYARVRQSERARWLRTAEDYYRRREQLRGVLQLIDLGVGPTRDDLKRARFLSQLGKPICLVLTKADKVGKPKQEAALRKAVAQLPLRPQSGVVLSSAHAGYGAQEIRAWIEDQLAAR
jgi:GTP-binding protein